MRKTFFWICTIVSLVTYILIYVRWSTIEKMNFPRNQIKFFSIVNRQEYCQSSKSLHTFPRTQLEKGVIETDVIRNVT